MVVMAKEQMKFNPETGYSNTNIYFSVNGNSNPDSSTTKPELSAKLKSNALTFIGYSFRDTQPSQCNKGFRKTKNNGFKIPLSTSIQSLKYHYLKFLSLFWI